MISIINKLVKEKQVKWQLLGLVIISSNAGGAWSPIGDVTTTMLWIGQQVTPLNIIKETFLASLTCMVVPTIIINYRIKGKIDLFEKSEKNLNALSSAFDRNLVFFIGIACLLFVPVFKTITHLPPYMGMLLSLGIMWVLTELLHSKKDIEEKGNLSVNHAIRKIDTPSILFFFGIYVGLLIRLVQLAERQTDTFGRVLGYSVACILFFHWFVNVGMTIGIIPVIGIPLPFISFGGSSLWAFTLLLFLFLRVDQVRK
jgi:cell division protein FtsW (lipid II flippase)